MKTVTMNKMQLVSVPSQEQDGGVIAFQVVEFIINFFGTVIITCHDTVIKQDGSQTVIGGCGYIPHGYKIN